MSAKPSLDDFKLVRVLGKGSYGKVMLVQNKRDASGTVYAMKMLRKENIVKRNQIEHTQTERKVLESMDHPFIVQLASAFQTPTKLYLVLEYCAGGELFFHLSRAGRFSESRAKYYAGQIMFALGHIHKHDVIYRDLKPENLLLSAEGHVKVTDFGLSKEGISDNISATTMCGTPEYLAPEILLKKGHGRAVDWYSMGAIIYEMLTGLPPYYTRDRQKLFDRIKKGDLTYPNYVQPVAKDIMMKLLSANPDKRLGGGPTDVEEIKLDPFWAGLDLERLLARTLEPPFKPDIKSGDDTKYFDKEFLNMPVANSEAPDAGEVKKFEGFTFSAK